MKLFTKTVNLIELTKLLERDTCDTLVSTNFIATPTYGDKSRPSVPSIDDSSWNRKWEVVIHQQYFTNIWAGMTIEIVPIKNKSDDKGVEYHIPFPTWSLVDSSYIDVKHSNGNVIRIPFNQEENYLLEYKPGNYSIKYHLVAEFTTGSPTNIYDITYYVQVDATQDGEKPRQPTITSVLKRLLAVHTVRRADKQPYYKLDPVIAEKFADVPAPEFAFTRCTLKEALDQIGGFIHAIPRLKWDNESDEARLVSFDLLGGNDEYKLPEDAVETGNAVVWDCNDYCGETDSYVDNFVNTIDKNSAVVTEPWEGFYKTLRTEYGNVRINNDNAIYETEFPIYQIEKVEVGFVNTDTVIGDITEFIYEAAEYQNLSSYLNSYPYSKGYALVYAQGGRSIDGFAYKLENAVSPALSKPAIENILRKTGYTGAIPAYKDLALRVSYIPIVSARVKQRKVEAAADKHNTLFYNQGANLVENNYYGQNMKGAVARMGKAVEMHTYVFRRYSDLPKIGQLFNGKYVFKVAKQFDKYAIKASVYLVEDFNYLSQYVGINSNKRFYEVSEKQSFDRNINFSEDIFIGDETTADTSLAEGAKRRFVSMLKGTPEVPITAAYIETKSRIGGTIAKLVKTVSAFACGNSVAFTFAMRDNFSAGARSVYYDEDNNLQQFIQYSDAYGTFENMRVAYYDKILNRAPSFADQRSTSTVAAIEDLLPQFGGTPDGGKAADFELVVKKDGRERISLTYQIHFRTTRKSIVLGTLLAQNNGLIKRTEGQKSPIIAFFLKPLNMLSGAGFASDYKTTNTAVVKEENGRVLISPIKNATSETFRAWGLVDPETQELYIGENMELPPNAETRPIYINF